MSVRRKKILIIEDEPDIVRGLKDSLEFEGFEVLAAADGREGVKLARDRSPDCVILDLMLGDVNGYAVCEEIRAHNAVVPDHHADRALAGVGQDPRPRRRRRRLRHQAVLRSASSSRASRPSSAGRAGSPGQDEPPAHRPVRGQRQEAHPVAQGQEAAAAHLLRGRAAQAPARARRAARSRRDEILDKIWGIQAHTVEPDGGQLHRQAARKVEDDHKQPRHILTVYGYGYKLVP
jgi:CheY-like chemotaxis protein